MAHPDLNELLNTLLPMAQMQLEKQGEFYPIGAIIVGSKIVSIDFKVSPDKNTYTLTIPDILEEKGVMKRDSAGQPLHVVPAMDLWGNKITYLENVVFKYHDKGVGEWDLSGHQANVKEFHTTKEMYANKKLLMQHGDMSGSWTAEQKKMIEDMGMKPD